MGPQVLKPWWWTTPTNTRLTERKSANQLWHWFIPGCLLLLPLQIAITPSMNFSHPCAMCQYLPSEHMSRIHPRKVTPKTRQPKGSELPSYPISLNLCTAGAIIMTIWCDNLPSDLKTRLYSERLIIQPHNGVIGICMLWLFGEATLGSEFPVSVWINLSQILLANLTQTGRVAGWLKAIKR